MKPAIWTDAFVELQPEEAVELLAKIGWRFIELADKHWRDIDNRQNPEEDFERLKGLCEGFGISIVQMHGPMFNVCVEEQRLRDMDLARRAIRWASILKVKWMVFHPGSLPDIAHDHDGSERVRETNREAIVQLLEGESEVGIAIENVHDGESHGRRSYGATPSELLWLVYNTDLKRVGVCWDTGHANLQRLDQSRAINALKGHLVATHIDDNDGSNDEHLLPFEGNVNWEAVTAALRGIGYDGLFDLEIGGAVHRIPLHLRERSLQYALQLAEGFCQGLRLR